MSKTIVFGVGGAGCGVLNHMIKSEEWKGTTFVAVDSDMRTLNCCKVQSKVLLIGESVQDRGMNDHIRSVRRVARRCANEIAEYLEGMDVAFILAGMGCVTGAGVAPILAEVAREMGILTVGIAFLPFRFEGRKRFEAAQLSLKEFKRSVDSLLVVDNEELLKLVDELPKQAVQGIKGLVEQNFEETRSALSEAGSTVMGIGIEEGEKKVEAAIQTAMGFPLNVSAEEATRIIVNITTGPGISPEEVERAMENVREKMPSGARLTFGQVIDASVGDCVKVTLFSTL